MRVSVRRATQADVPFLVALVQHAEVAPYLAAVRASSEDEVRAEVERSERDPEAFGVIVIEVDGTPAGTVTWEQVNRRSRIASIGGFAIAPEHRGRGVGTEAARALQRHLIRDAGFHRLQMEIYGFNERALRHAERTGWIREGVRRKAYWRDDAWVDGVLFGLVDGGPRPLAGAEESVETLERLRSAEPTEPEADMAGLVVDLAREEEHARVGGEALAERLRVVDAQARKADR